MVTQDESWCGVRQACAYIHLVSNIARRRALVIYLASAHSVLLEQSGVSRFGAAVDNSAARSQLVCRSSMHACLESGAFIEGPGTLTIGAELRVPELCRKNLSISFFVYYKIAVRD